MTPAAAPPSLTERLWAICARAPGPGDRARAALHLVDWLGCALAGAATPAGRALAAAQGGGNPFARTGPAGAAAAGGLGSLLEMDDVHRGALLHPGPAVIPAVLAMGRAAAAGPILDAILAGYEAVIRLGAAVGPGHYARFHNSGTCGGIGAAAGAARVMGLDAAQAVGAMGHAMSVSGGLWQARNEPVMTKHWHVAEAARHGAQAAALAQAGLPGPRFILEGPQGFFAGMAPDGDPGRVVAPADGWKIAGVSLKPWPACRHAHPAIDAALVLRERLGGQAPRAVAVATYADAVTFCDRPQPRTEGEAKFSLQHAVAVVLARGRPGLADFAGEALDDPALAALRACVTVAADPALTAAYPAHFGARLTATAGGETLTCAVADAWGDPENPMDDAAVLAKYDRLAEAAGLPAPLAADLRGAALGLAGGAPPAAFFALLSRLPFPPEPP
jgi:2-methylcitrate dehydratase PrpD